MEVNSKTLLPIRVNSLGIDMGQVLWDYVQTSCDYAAKFGRTFDQMMCEFLNPFKGKSEYQELTDYYKSLEDSRDEESEQLLMQNHCIESNANDLEYDYGSDHYHSDSESDSDDDEFCVD